MSTYDYRKTTTLITGASQGIGASLARALSQQGSDLVLVARSEAKLTELAAQIRSATGQRVEVIPADLSDRDEPERIAAHVDDRGMAVDLLVNNAGMGAVGPFLDRPYGANQYSVDVNISALMAMTYQLGRGMVERGTGGIINVGSVAGFQPMPYQASYGASKAFVLSFTEALREELHGVGVRVMSAHPGPVATGFFDSTTARIDPKAVTPDHIAANIIRDFARGRAISLPGKSLSDRANIFASRILARTTITGMVGRLNRRNGYDDVEDIK